MHIKYHLYLSVIIINGSVIAFVFKLRHRFIPGSFPAAIPVHVTKTKQYTVLELAKKTSFFCGGVFRLYYLDHSCTLVEDKAIRVEFVD